jgi:hypothetical protein
VSNIKAQSENHHFLSGLEEIGDLLEAQPPDEWIDSKQYMANAQVLYSTLLFYVSA